MVARLLQRHRLDGFDASVALTSAKEVLGRPATQRATRHALDRVERALGHLRTTSPHPKAYTPQDCVTTLDRATAHALIHDDDEALRNAEAACKALGRRPYYAATIRLDTLADILPTSKLGQLHEIETAYLGAAEPPGQSGCARPPRPAARPDRRGRRGSASPTPDRRTRPHGPRLTRTVRRPAGARGDVDVRRSPRGTSPAGTPDS